MSMNRAQRREAIAYLERENAKAPERMTEIPREEWPADMYRLPAGRLPQRAWRSRFFLAQLFEERGQHLRLSINRTMIDESTGGWLADLRWEDLMRVKAECGFSDLWAVEVCPPDSEVVNVANMRHLWLLDKAPPYAWRKE